jgi:hypothetical protein
MGAFFHNSDVLYAYTSMNDESSNYAENKAIIRRNVT